MLIMLQLTNAGAQLIPLQNPGFESGLTDWQDLKVGSSTLQAAPEGDAYAYQLGSDMGISQRTSHRIASSETISLSVWVRGINGMGNTAETMAEVRMLAGSTVLGKASLPVNPPQLKGAASDTPNDDGANIWIDGDYRHQFSDKHMIQHISNDPLLDEWHILENSGYEDIERLGWAVGNVIAGEHRYVYGTLYRDQPGNFYSSITMSKALPMKGQDYAWSKPITLISHSGTEFPWVEDPHLFYDEDEDRLWLSWGGGTCYVTEIDPATGTLIPPQDNPEIFTHLPTMHHPVAAWPETDEGWCGDEWSTCWMEGAALYKHGAYWYYFGSYGHLGLDYTIRCGRGSSPTGPFYDKHGLDMMEFDPRRECYGNTMVLGVEADQRVPGHPHIWEENDQFYMGYDYRKPESGKDLMGIRRLYWVGGWPTIWQPLQLKVRVDRHPESIGELLTIELINTGEAESMVAFDRVRLIVKE